MTCSKNFDRLLQATCLGLVGMLAVAGCGGSSNPVVVDTGAKPDVVVVIPVQDAAPAPKLAVSPASLNFGSVIQGETSTGQTVTVTNTGALVVVSPTVTGAGFTIDTTNTTCGTAAATCTITLKFSPGSVGGANGILTVATGLTVSLSGTGLAVGTFRATPSVIPPTLLVNQSASISVTVTATQAMTDLSCLASGPDLTADLTTTTCTGTVAASVPCAYVYTFKAATAGPKSDSIVCSSGGNVQTIPVTPTVVTPASLAIGPNPGSFSAVVGATSTAIAFNLANSGGSNSGSLTTALSGVNASDFAITDNKCVVPLGPLSVCAIQVVFKPATVGTKIATLTVTDATAGSTPVSATLNGTAIGTPAVAITGAGNLGTVTVGQAGPASTYTITNSGGSATGALAVAAGDAEFAIGSDLCSGLPLAAGKTCTLTVAFSPTSAGVKSAVLNASSGGAVLGTLQIQGTGAAVVAPPGPPVLTMTPPTLDFGTIGVGIVSATQAFTVTNTGATASGVLSVVKNDSTSSVGGGSQFSYTTTCQAALAPAATCQVVVTFSPTIALSASATITVTDGTVSSTSHTVIGIALARPGITIYCGDGSFGQAVVGQTSSPKVCTVSNDSQSTQATGTLTAATTGPYAIATNNCSASLAPGLSCTLSLVFKPTAKGESDGTVTVTGTNGGTANANLSGTGLGVIEIQEYPLSCSTITHSTGCTKGSLLTAGNYNFGSLPVGANSSTQSTPTKVLLAVFVRGQVGNLAVTGALGTPADFVQETTPSPGFVWDTTTTVSDCSLTAPSTTVTTSTTVPFCVVLLDFNPQSKGAKTGTVTALGGDATTDSATVQGNATGPIYIVPSALTFSAVAVGTAGTTQMTLSVCNAAATAATGAQFSITGANAADFVVTNDQVTAATIPAGLCKLINLILDIPASETAKALAATVTASATVAGATESDTATLSGTLATGPALTATLGAEFGSTAITAISAPVTVTVGNSGGLGTSPVTFTIPSGSEFSLTPPGTQAQGTCVTTCPTGVVATACGVALAPAATCTLKVWFQPTGGLGVGLRTDTLTVSSTNAGSKVLTLRANATSQITVTPATLTISTPAAPSGVFGGSNPQPFQTITITNLGQAIPAGGLLAPTYTDVITKLATTNFTVKTNNCAGGLGAVGSVSPAPTCTMDIQMSVPGTSITNDQPVTESAKMTLTVNATSQTASTVLTGTTAGGADVLFTTATNLKRDFGAVAVNGTSASIKYTVKNYGGFSSGALTFGIYDSPLATTPVAHIPAADFVTTGSTCVSGTTVLAPGQTCDILVAFSPTSATSSSALTEALIVAASPGTPTAPYASAAMTAVKAAAGPYIVENTSLTAPYDYGTAGSTATLKICNPAGGSAFTFATSSAVAFSLDSANPTAASGVAGEFATAALATTTNECSFTGGGPVLALNGGDCCLFGVTWTPATISSTQPSGTRVVTVTVKSGSTATSNPMTLYAHRLGPAVLTAVPTAVAFGSAIESTNSAKMTVVVTNTGESATSAVVAAASNNAQLLVVSPDTTCTAKMNPGDTCNLVLMVNPTALGAQPSSPAPAATVATAGTTTDTAASVLATWTGVVAATITATPTAQDFGSLAVGAKSSVFTISVANAASALPTGPLSFTVDDADFAVKATSASPATTDCGYSGFLANGLVAGGHCNVFLTFTPLALASAATSGNLVVTSTGAPVVKVALTGTATAALVVSAEVAAPTTDDSLAMSPLVGCVYTAASGTTPAVCSFATGASITETKFESETFTLQNTGGQATGLLVASLAGANAGEFRIVKDLCTGTSVAAQTGTCNVTVRFAPSSIGTKAASLTVSGTPGDSVTVGLSGAANP